MSEEKKENGFTQIPNSILFSGNHTHAVIWGIIRHFETMEKGICKCSIKTLASYSKLSETQVKYHLSKMVDDGILNIVYTPGRRNQYITKCKQSEQISGDDTGIIECTQPDFRPRTCNDSSYPVGFPTPTQSDFRPPPSRISDPLNDIEKNNIKGNNNIISMSCHVSAHTHEEKIPDFFDFDVANPEFDKNKPEQINFDILPWLPGVPDKVYHIAKSIDYRMTVSEMYKFSLMLAIGGYYNGYTFCPVNNISLMLLKWKKKQDEISRMSSIIDDLDNVPKYLANQGKILKTVKIPYGAIGDIIIERLQPISSDPDIFINRESCRFEHSTSYSKQEKRKFADGKHLPSIKDYGESDDF